MKIIIIGGGNMGLTFAKAFINNHVVTSEQLIILEKNPTKKQELEAYKLATISSNPEIVRDAELVILSVKPQDAPILFEQIKDYVDKSQVVLSIMAGINVRTIEDNLNVTKVIRAMPNLPSQIGLGMTAFTATEEVTRFEVQYIQNLLQKTGKTLNVQNEELIDSVTAISGSGPAYIYYFLDSLIEGAMAMGINKIDATMLVKQTAIGALSLLRQNSLSCTDWIDRVASRGGTTEAAISFFNQHKVNSLIQDGAHAALQRAKELGKT